MEKGNSTTPGPEVPWEDRLVSPEQVIRRIDSGMCIFVGTGAAEPRTLVRHLLKAESVDFKDIELLQLISLGDLVSSRSAPDRRFRLKTFYSGGDAGKAIRAGRIDLIPSRFSRIPALIETGRIPVDGVLVQISPPDPAGYCSLGPAVDIARAAMAKACLVVGEINPRLPRTCGDTFVPVSDFHFLVSSAEPLIHIERCPVHPVWHRVAANVASLIEDGACIGFSIGPLYEALGPYLQKKRHLGIHSPFFTDVMMDLVVSGAVTNRYKALYRGKSLTSYAMGTPVLMQWLDRNPLVEFQAIDTVFDPLQMGRNDRFVAVLPAHKADLSGRVVLDFDSSRLSIGPEEAIDMFNGAGLSRDGGAVFALPSRDAKGAANIRLSVERFTHRFALGETVDTLVTEYGIASLVGRTVRERAQSLIDIAHPEDRLGLVEQAKKANILYPDQIFLSECARVYPSDMETEHVFKGDLAVRFRAIKPSDEEEMRRLFYRFSDEAVFYRYFSPITAMPHAKMQAYVNADCNIALSIVGEIGEPGRSRIIAEARFVRLEDRPYAEVAFVVDEAYQGRGIASFLFRMLIRMAKERGLQGFTADVLPENRAMMAVFEKGGHPVIAKLTSGIYQLTIPFHPASAAEPKTHS